MKIPNHKLSSAIAVALGVQLGSTITLAAELLPGDVLTITSGTLSCDAYGDNCIITGGSWFGMDSDGNEKIATSEQFPVIGVNGITIGTTQPANDIDEWEYFGNAGTHLTTVAPAGGTDTGINFSGWTVFWNNVSIDMGVGAWTPIDPNCAAAHMGCEGVIFSNGMAAITWDGVYGNSYSLWYSATVPDDGSTNFGDVKYMTRLMGTVVSGAPVAADFSISTPVDGFRDVDLTSPARVTDPNGNDTIDWLTLSMNCNTGNITDNGNGTLRYTPTEGTEDNCTYTVNDEDGRSSNAGTMTVTILPSDFINTPPTADNVELEIITGASTDWVPLADDIDEQPLTCTIEAGDEPLYGEALVAPDCSSGTYEHDGGASTTDSFTYTVSDGFDAATGLVSISISVPPNVAPVATNFAAAAVGTTPVNIDFTTKVTDADGNQTIAWNTLNVTCSTGTTTHNNAGTVTYTAATDFFGTDLCDYSVSDEDGAVSNPATLTVTVNEPVTGGVLPSGTVVLRLTAGEVVLKPDGSKEDVVSGSWFAMDTDGNSRIAGLEKTALQPGPDGGLIIGTLQGATGSHSGPPNGSENTSVDAPWNFFGNTGMHFTSGTAPVAIDGDTGNGINLSGWRVTWNGITAINMGTDAWNPMNCAALDITICTFSNGVAQFTWEDTDNSGNISHGDSYRLIYAATVPEGDPSGFGGVRYLLNLEGTIAVIPLPTTGAGATLLNGDLGGTAANGFRPTSELPADPDFSNVGGYFDYRVDCGSTNCVADTYIPLSTLIPANAVLRKFGVTPGNPAGGWSNFDDTGSDSIASADSASGGGDCAAADYSAGLTAGHDCLRVTQMDGGPNDTDPTGGIIGDPSGIAVPAAVATPSDLSSGTSGCTIATSPVSITKAGDWLLIGGLLAALGLYRRKRLS